MELPRFSISKILLLVFFKHTFQTFNECQNFKFEIVQQVLFTKKAEKKLYRHFFLLYLRIAVAKGDS
jgi:hypothetical protein